MSKGYVMRDRCRVPLIFAMLVLSITFVSLGCTGRGTNADDVFAASGEVLKEERIVFQDNGGSICSIRPDGSDERIVEKPAEGEWSYYRVSPSGRWLLVLPLHKKNLRIMLKEAVRLYDLWNASFRRIAIPEGNWEWTDCWWSDDSNKFHAYNATVHEDLPYDITRNTKRIVEQILTYRVDTGDFIVQSYKKEKMTLWDYIIERGPIAPTKCDFASPDGNSTLTWDVPDSIQTYGQPCGSIYSGSKSTGMPRTGHYDILLISNSTSERRLVFKNDNDKFASVIVEITEHPWSPDSKHFVLERFSGGFWRAVFSGQGKNNKIRGVYVVDRDTLEWRFVIYGGSPHWLSKVPLKFTEQVSPPARITFVDN